VLTKKGRREVKVVLTGGVFDIVHIGHLATLQEAKKLGDILTVVVARDKTVEKMKRRKPINEEMARLGIIRSLKPVDFALLGSEKDMFDPVRKIKPDFIVLGYDQEHDEKEIEKRLRKLGMTSTKVIRLKVAIPGLKTSEIISKIVRN
jgi:rfaE bifunctional protein nucleotidyltransferase chain/domain